MPDPRNADILVGYQAQGTRGRDLVEGTTQVNILPPYVVYAVHGDLRASEALATRIRAELGWLAVVPRDGERVLLG